MQETLTRLIFVAGVGQLGCLTAAALVPIQLEWRKVFNGLPRLHRQMYWVYGAYIVLAIMANGLVSICLAPVLAKGSILARAVCAYLALFWGIRLSLQLVLDAKPYLTAWWLHAGEYALTVLFCYFTLVFAFAAVHGAQ